MIAMGTPHPLLLPLLTGGDLPADTVIALDVIESAEEHWVAALIDVAVTDRGLSVTAEARARLMARSLATEAEVAACVATASRVVEIAESLGIEIAIFKGLAIGARFYDDPATRPSIDVDIFVAPRDVRRMGELAVALGSDADDGAAIDAMVEEDRVFETSVVVDDVMVDVHRDPMNMVTLSNHDHASWFRTVTFELPDGTVARTLGLEDTIIQALLHLFRDNFADLLHINDVRLLMDAEPDWGVVALRAEEEGWTDIIRYATWFVCDTLGRPSPLPTRIARWRKIAIGRVWPREILLQGHRSHAQGARRQSALSLLVTNDPIGLARAYRQRILPPRSVIEHRSGPSNVPYPLALVRWRLEQRRQARAFRNAGGEQ